MPTGPAAGRRRVVGLGYGDFPERTALPPEGMRPIVDRSHEHLGTDAAFALFDVHGFDETTVDDVAARAGVGRSAFFRAFWSREDVIFPDHDDVIGAIRDRPATATAATAPVAVTVTESARLVLLHYLAEGSARASATA